jgi:Protein of unknown function (DUF3303)
LLRDRGASAGISSILGELPALQKIQKRKGMRTMKFMSSWSLLPGSVKTAAEQFLNGGGLEGEGVTLLGRWHKADCTGGFTLYESSSAAALHLGAAKWADLLAVTIVPVIEDAEAGANLVATFKN